MLQQTEKAAGARPYVTPAVVTKDKVKVIRRTMTCTNVAMVTHNNMENR